VKAVAATADGKLASLSHEGWEVTSRPSGYNVSGTETTARMYACPNIHTAVNIVHADRSTPGFMRAPPVALLADGRAEVAIAGHEIGTGAYTTVAVIAARALGLSPERIHVQMGDSDLPPLMIAGGSNNAASASLVIAKACEQIRDRLARSAVAASSSPLHGLDPGVLTLDESGLTDGAGRREPLSAALSRIGQRLEVYAENVPARPTFNRDGGSDEG
jgi:CO/xanthine dehydrogenase Mo-binding subunit